MKNRYSIMFVILLVGVFLVGCQTKNPEPDIFVEKIDNLKENIIKGVDVSSVLALEKSGVTFKSFDGKEQDIFKTLEESGVNSVRLRIWNDPYDNNGNGYGGGTNDLNTAIELGKRATKYHHSVLIDFHYSDFWADPAKQQAPKKWQNMSIDEKEVAIYTYTSSSLKSLLDEKVNVTMVQVGNETTRGFCGETNWKEITRLFQSASKAIRDVSSEYNKTIKIGIHFTNPEKEGSYDRYASILENFKVDYDVFISSYYPYWHGSLDNLSTVLDEIATKYNKEVLVGEVSYAYTFENGDFQTNSITEESVFEKVEPISVQGQANVIRNVIKTINDIDKGIGVYYWEPAWIPVPRDNYDEQKLLWEEFGSGWASSYATEYDPKDAGLWYGGTSWDNQGLFDFEGKPLASLDVFRLVEFGATTDIKIDEIENAEVRTRKGQEIILPETVIVRYNNGEKKDVNVSWEMLDSKIKDVAGIYEVIGAVVNNQTGKNNSEIKVEDSSDNYNNVKCKIVVMEPNYIENPGFEDLDVSMWKLNNNSTTEVGVLEKVTDARTDFNSYHFYSTEKVDFTLEQSIENVKDGSYNLSLFIQGGDINNGIMKLYAIVDAGRYDVDMTVDGWANWQNPSIDGIPVTNGNITIGISVTCDPGGWGSVDDFSLFPIED